MNSKENIAFVGALPPPLGGVGVINKSFQEIVSPQWNVIAFNTSTGKLNEDLYKIKGFKNLWHFIKNIYGLLQFLRKNSFKVVNVFSTSNIAFIRDSVIIVLLWICRKKIVIHFHSKKKGEFFLHPYTIGYISFIFRLAKKVIVLSQDHYQYFSQYFDKSKMVVIENFVDYKLYDCEIEKKGMEFLYVGRLSEKKGFFDLIKAVKIVKEKGFTIKINVLGTAENEDIKILVDKELKNNNLEENIILKGHVQGIQKYDYYKKCRIFIFPSHYENSPVVLKEAIASKMAIICSDIEANKIILKDKGNTRFFVSENAADLATKIEDLLLEDYSVEEYMRNSERCKKYDKEYANSKINDLFLELQN